MTTHRDPVITEETTARLKLTTWWQITTPLVGVAIWLTILLYNAKHELALLSLENRRDHEKLMVSLAEVQRANYVRGGEIEEAIVALHSTTNLFTEDRVRRLWREIRRRHEQQ